LAKLSAKTRDAAQSRRLLAIAMVLDGISHEEAARQAAMDRQTLRGWVHRYNEAGQDGLISRAAPAPQPKLSTTQMDELRTLVIAGPDAAIHRLVRCRCVDLRAEVASRFRVTVDVRTIGKWLGKLRLTRVQPRPYHPNKDPAAEAAFKKNFGSLLKDVLLGTAAGRPIEVWFQDEARIGQQGTHADIWAPIGARPLMVRDNRHDSAYIFGAICPSCGVRAAMITPAANIEMMNLRLAEIGTQVAPGACAVMLCDRAGWHQQGKDLVLPENIRLLPLPPYSSELNPMENIWDYLRQNNSVQPSGIATNTSSKPAKPLATGSSPIQTASAPSALANGQRSISKAVGTTPAAACRPDSRGQSPWPSPKTS
jgi:transposase